jgi:hypothetical protein
MTLASTGGLLNTTQSLMQAGLVGSHKGYMSNNLHFGTTARFEAGNGGKSEDRKPGPGWYND